MRAIQIARFGDPDEVVRVVDLPEPPDPGADEVKVAVELAPLNLHDLLVVSREATPLVASGAPFVPPAAVFDLDDIHAAVEQLHRGGKILLKVARS